MTHFTMDDGLKAKIYDNSTLHEFFKKKFPEGITVVMPKVSLVDLNELDEMKISENFHNLGLTEFWGKVNNTQGYLEYADEGILQAEIRLKPEDYHLIMPEDTYANMDDNVECEDWDWNVKAATTFAHLHGQDTNDMTVEITKGIESLRHFYIEGRLFADVMKSVHNTSCTNEMELKQLLTLMNIYDHGLKGKPVPEIVEPLVQKAVPDYEKLDSMHPNVREQKILMGIQDILLNTGVMRMTGFILNANFDPADNNRAAREVVAAVNKMVAGQSIERNFARAEREGNHVTVSANVMPSNRHLAQEVESIVRTHPQLLDFQKEQYKAILDDYTYLVLDTGQAVKGYLNKESLFQGKEYTWVSQGVDGNIQRMKLRDEPGDASRHTLFTAMDEVTFPKLSGNEVRVHQQMTAQQWRDSLLVGNINFFELKDEPEKVFITGRTNNYQLTGVRLNATDTRIYKEAKAMGDETNMHIIKQAFASVYYKEAIEMECERRDSINRSTAERMHKKNVILQRITEPELYGKADDLHIRCVIDGKLQEGRPLKGYDITKSHTKAGAALLGKDYLNYYNYFHESVLKEMAANTFKDVLTGRVEQQQRTRGLKL